jgi:integrase
MKFTERSVKALTLPPGKIDHIEWDDEVRRFGYRLRLAAGGKINRTWVVQYRHGGATRRMSLGEATVDQARKRARKALGRVDNGEDPQADKQDRRDKDRQTFKATVADYLAIKKRDVRSRTFTEKTRYLTGPYFKPLHGLALDQITRADVATRLNRITVESSSTVAALARAQLSALFTWALTQGLTEANPVIGTETPKGGKPRDRVLSDGEIAAIWRACGDDDHGRCIKLLILTGCRRQEIGGMCWREFDDPGNPSTWTLPATRAKNHHAHTLPVMPMMFDVIKGTPHLASRDTLFGTRGNGYVAWSHGKQLLDERAGLEKGWTTHDIRRSVATHMAELGIMPHVIETILNHLGGHEAGPAGVYNHSKYHNAVRAALATWHDHLETLVTGGKRKFISMPAVAAAS